MARFLVFGDSITYGAWDKECGWVQRLREVLDKKTMSSHGKFYYIVYNMGISGDTTEDLLKRFEFETKQRKKDTEENVILFAIGINDSQFIHSKKAFKVPSYNFKINVEKLIKMAKKYSSKIAFIGLTPVEEVKTTPILWDKNKSYTNKHIQRYNEIVKNSCKQNKVPFIEIFDDWIKTDYKKLLYDGLHPNSKGHQRIFEAVRNYLTKNKII